MPYLAIAAIGYLFGSIPVAYGVTLLTTGRDLRTLGTGNVGVMSTFIHAGPRRGLLVMILEGAKGFFAVLLGQRLVADEWASGLALLAAVVGTNWPIWLWGRGSRGNTAFAGGLLLISWPSLIVILSLLFFFRWMAGSMFLATRIRIFAQPLIIGLLTGSLIYAAMGVGASLIFLSKHRRASDDHLLFRMRWHERLRKLFPRMRG